MLEKNLHSQLAITSCVGFAVFDLLEFISECDTRVRVCAVCAMCRYVCLTNASQMGAGEMPNIRFTKVYIHVVNQFGANLLAHLAPSAFIFYFSCGSMFGVLCKPHQDNMIFFFITLHIDRIVRSHIFVGPCALALFLYFL